MKFDKSTAEVRRQNHTFAFNKFGMQLIYKFDNALTLQRMKRRASAASKKIHKLYYYITCDWLTVVYKRYPWADYKPTKTGKTRMTNNLLTASEVFVGKSQISTLPY